MSSANLINHGGSAFVKRLSTRGEGYLKTPDFMLTLYVNRPHGEFTELKCCIAILITNETSFDGEIATWLLYFFILDILVLLLHSNPGLSLNY